jgi:hypothetical protein
LLGNVPRLGFLTTRPQLAELIYSVKEVMKPSKLSVFYTQKAQWYDDLTATIRPDFRELLEKYSGMPFAEVDQTVISLLRIMFDTGRMALLSLLI